LEQAAKLEEAIFTTQNPIASHALEVFAFQYAHNPLYREFSNRLGRTPLTVDRVEAIPYLPIEFFKSRRVIASTNEDGAADLVFRSSGTTGQVTSAHHVLHAQVYHRSYMQAFEHFYGAPENYRILALLPGYLERADSSLVYMVQGLIGKSGHAEGGFFLDNIEGLCGLLQKPCERHTLLIGVSFALLDLAESHPQMLENTTLMETGGMKGRRREPTRQELHQQLSEAFGLQAIHAEYGMTELLSQAYAKKEGHFETPPWMALQLREINDPLSAVTDGRSGAINVIDLANLYSCSFIATSDLGRKHPDGSTEVLGRMDYSDMRGCNLMVSDFYLGNRPKHFIQPSR
jgi:phenylacetate-coenzyme A ligase PaaK-like adenylate-forming protein